LVVTPTPARPTLAPSLEITPHATCKTISKSQPRSVVLYTPKSQPRTGHTRERTGSDTPQTQTQRTTSVRRDGTRPGFWDVRPTRGNASAAPNHARGGRFSHGPPCYLRCPASCNFSLSRSCLKFVFISVTNMDRPTRPKSRTGADRPTFQNTYSRTDRPGGPLRARDRFPSQRNTSGQLSLAQGRPYRPYTRTRTYAR
jgi:hypothetical protein